VGSSVVASGATGAAYIIFFAGFFCGAVLWCFIITAALHWGKHWLGPHAFRWVNLLCGCVLGYFGLRILWLTIQSWAEQHFSTYLNDHRLLLGLRHAD
jgi:threonine/homoserine/homoserine lactone efflux protein